MFNIAGSDCVATFLTIYLYTVRLMDPGNVVILWSRTNKSHEYNSKISSEPVTSCSNLSMRLRVPEKNLHISTGKNSDSIGKCDLYKTAGLRTD